MKINIYYGGRGLMDDPTLFVINKMKEVLEELRVTVEYFQLYELKNSITTLPQSLKTADGVILATTVEWYGIGGYMQQFLDSCWLYGDKERISEIYMSPIVMSTTYGERGGMLDLVTAWEILGGLPCDGICGYITDTSILEENEEYIRIIEKKAENLYRTINQKMACLPASNQAVKQKVAITKNINFTPQESEQLSQYVADDTYVQRQKADIQELASMFRDMMGSSEKEDTTEFLKEIQEHFKPQPGLAGDFKIVIEEKKTPLFIGISGGDLRCFYGVGSHADVEVQMPREVMN
ncbi:MAG: SCP-2 sterol transfer family protein, partial [Lachnospiraceae bacterium]|nr:SCP-2 sterol transfer family protein [Lachnospiraceae bacterium]